jgi:hypothetical protein
MNSATRRVYYKDALRMKNFSIESSGRKKLYLWVEENFVPTKEFPYIYIYNWTDWSRKGAL